MSRRDPLPWPYEELFRFTLLDAGVYLVTGMAVGLWVILIALVVAGAWG